MSKYMTRKMMMVLSIFAVVGFGTYAFAGWGMDDGRYGRGHHGPGPLRPRVGENVTLGRSLHGD